MANSSPECLKDSEPIIRGQVPWRACERRAARGGGQEQREADVHRQDSVAREMPPVLVVTWPTGASGIALVFFSQPTLCLDLPSPTEAVTYSGLRALPRGPAWAC